MKAFLVITAIILFIAFSMTSRPSVSVYRGSTDGNAYRQYSFEMQQAYAAGVMDSLYTANIIHANQKLVAAIVECTKGWPGPQMHAVIEKYMDANPADWNSSMAGIIYLAIRGACPSLNAAHVRSWKSAEAHPDEEK